MTNKYHQYRNENPLKQETEDCVVRALVTATGKTWDIVYKELCDLGFELKKMPNSKDTWKEYLNRNSFENHIVSNKKGSKRPTVLGFTKEHKEGIFILSIANHLTVCKDGIYYDIWDCGTKSLYGYWSK